MQPALKPESTVKELPTIENRVHKLEQQIAILEADNRAFRKILHGNGHDVETPEVQ